MIIRVFNLIVREKNTLNNIIIIIIPLCWAMQVN